MNEQSRNVRQPGLYRREYEHDACGVGMVANLLGEASHDIVEKGMTILKRLMHRGATGNDPETGDGAGLLMKIPRQFFKKVLQLPNHQTPFGVAMIFGGEGVFNTVVTGPGRVVLQTMPLSAFAGAIAPYLPVYNGN